MTGSDIAKQKQINHALTEQEFTIFNAELAKSQTDANIFVTKYSTTHNLSQDETLALILIEALRANNEDATKYALESDTQHSLLTYMDSSERCPIKVLLGASTSLEIKHSVLEYLQTHSFQKVELSPTLFSRFNSFVATGEEYDSAYQAAQKFLVPLFMGENLDILLAKWDDGTGEY